MKLKNKAYNWKMKDRIPSLVWRLTHGRMTVDLFKHYLAMELLIMQNHGIDISDVRDLLRKNRRRR